MSDCGFLHRTELFECDHVYSKVCSSRPDDKIFKNSRVVPESQRSKIGRDQLDHKKPSNGARYSPDDLPSGVLDDYIHRNSSIFLASDAFEIGFDASV